VLHPEIPPGGVTRAAYFGEARAREAERHLARFAAGFGIEGLRAGDRIPSTRAALTVAEHARGEGKLHPFRRAAMEAYWLHGRDIEDRAVLAECARAAGLDPGRAVAAVDDPTLQGRVEAMGEEARRAGVTGIPTFVIGRRRVVGCQPYPVLAQAAEAEGAARRA
jgi:predicted DsbA family dithiol-disulfide isomerase